MNTKHAVEVHNVHKRFSYSRHKNNSLKRAITQIFKKKDTSKEEFYALDGISFNVEKGDFFGILGRNGSGKSTLLKIISEIYRPTSGSVKHDGKLVSFIELGVGFKAELTGRENVYLNGGLLGFSKQEVDAMYDDIVEFAELEDFMGQQLKNYSSGMKVRLAFSVAIRAKADILILDEVLAVGDAAFQRKCNEYFETLKDDGRTVILVTHSMNAVREYCNKAILIEGGVITHQGDAEEVSDEYLKLFNKKDGDVDASKTHWGTGRVEIENFSLVCKKDLLEVNVKLATKKEAVRGVKFGITIKDSVGNVVTGINSVTAKGGKKLNFKTGEMKTLKITSPNILGKGSYKVTATVANFSGEVFDKRDDIANITNNKFEVYYPTVLPAEITIT